MYRCLVWGTGKVFSQNHITLKYYEKIGQIEIGGVTSKDEFYESIYGWKFVAKNVINVNDYDCLIVMAEGRIFKSICDDAKKIGFKECYIVPFFVLSLPGFCFEKYVKLKKDPPTIFCQNCWGGLTYHSLGLPFVSPLINMWLGPADYMKFLRNPKYYLSCELKYVETRFDNVTKINYPVVLCDDLVLHFNHYDSFQEAQTCWNRRKQRINWNNIVAMYFEEELHFSDVFLSLENSFSKICFVPYEADGVFQINSRYLENSDIPIWQIVNGMAQQKNIYYDVFDLLLNNKFEIIAKYK